MEEKREGLSPELACCQTPKQEGGAYCERGERDVCSRPRGMAFAEARRLFDTGKTAIN
jgi:hypothetical protein